MSKINEFAKQVWDEAKQELTQLDPKFVTSMAAAAKLTHKGFWVPTQQPQKRLGASWIELLESCSDVIWQAELLQYAAELAGAPHIGTVTKIEAGKLRIYHLTNWLHHAYALTEKSERLIVLYCKIHSAKTISDKYIKQLRDHVTKSINEVRTPLAHGAGGKGIFMRGITEKGLWEAGVALGIMPNDFIPHSYEVGLPKIDANPKQVIAAAEQVLDRLGQVLLEVKRDISARSQTLTKQQRPR